MLETNMMLTHSTSLFICLFIELQTYEGKSGYRLKQDHHYNDQVQGELHVLNRSACDFVVWTTKDIAIVRIMQVDAKYGQTC